MKHRILEAVLELTQKCNLRCSHCGSDCGSLNDGILKKELSIEEWKNCLDQLKDLKVRKVIFSGGEPTIKEGFVDLLFHAKSIGLRVGFITNGFEFPESLKEAVSKSRPFAIGISIDGLRNTHNEIRKNSQSWSRIISTISIIKELDIKFCAVTTINRLNYRDLPKLAGFLNLAGADSWQLQLAMPFGRMSDNEHLLIDEPIFKEVCHMIMDFRDSYPQMNIQAADCFCLAPEGAIRSVPWPGCGAGIYSLGIDAFGNVMPCLSIRNAKSCGSIREKKIKEIWEKSKGFDFNRKFDKRKAGSNCSECNFIEQCRGGCNSQSMAYYGHYHDSPFCFARSFLGVTTNVNKKEEKGGKPAYGRI